MLNVERQVWILKEEEEKEDYFILITNVFKIQCLKIVHYQLNILPWLILNPQRLMLLYKTR
jgi:hypothetical protein